jgi:hypothetical protein
MYNTIRHRAEGILSPFRFHMGSGSPMFEIRIIHSRTQVRIRVHITHAWMRRVKMKIELNFLCSLDHGVSSR